MPSGFFRHQLCMLPKSSRRPWRLWHPLVAFLVAAPTLVYLFYVFAFPQILRFRFQTGLSWYDLGWYGFGPSQSYISFGYESPKVEILQWSSECDSRYVFLAPKGDSISHPGPMIMDSRGELVWMKHNWEITQDFNVQRFGDQDYLTYWEGEMGEGRGMGSWYMLDSSYTERFRVSPVGKFVGDLHEFHLTNDGTALGSIYDIAPADLTPVGGPARGWIYDGLFQEIDIETGELVFEWRASDHYPINTTFKVPVGTGEYREAAFDYFHINSVDKDHQGNYIVSARHAHSISCIDRDTGEVLWTLGGKLNDFTDMSDGEAISFSWQHDARWHGNSTLTLFDNAAGSNQNPSAVSRGMVIDLDVPARQATLRGAYYHPQDMEAVSQGNLQLLPNGNVFVGWGHSAAFTEFRADGTPLCNIHFGASAYFTFGRVVSYRVLKGSWVGKPETVPDAEIDGDHVYVSWNGATEVATWRLEVWDGANFTDMTFEPRGQFEKDGFETAIAIPDDVDTTYFRLVALDSQDEELGVSDPIQRKSASSSSDSSRSALIAFGLIFSGCLLAGLYCGLRRVLPRRRRKSSDYQLVRMPEEESSPA